MINEKTAKTLIQKEKVFTQIVALVLAKSEKEFKAHYKLFIEAVAKLGEAKYNIPYTYEDMHAGTSAYFNKDNGHTTYNQKLFDYMPPKLLIDRNKEIARQTIWILLVMEHENAHALDFSLNGRHDDNVPMIEIYKHFRWNLDFANILQIFPKKKNLFDDYSLAVHDSLPSEAFADSRGYRKIRDFFQEFQAWVEKNYPLKYPLKTGVAGKYQSMIFSLMPSHFFENYRLHDLARMCKIGSADTINHQQDYFRLVKDTRFNKLAPEMRKICKKTVEHIVNEREKEPYTLLYQFDLLPLMLLPEIYDDELVNKLIAFNKRKATSTIFEDYEDFAQLWCEAQALHHAELANEKLALNDWKATLPEYNQPERER